MLVTGNDAIPATSRHELLGVDLQQDVDKRPFGWAEGLAFGPDRGPGLQSPVTMFYIEGADQKILVDTGYDPTDESDTGPRAAFGQARDTGVDRVAGGVDGRGANSRRWACAPTRSTSSSTHICTSITSETTTCSPGATFIAQERELTYAINPPDWVPFYFREFSPKVLDVLDRLELIDGETRVNDHVSLVRLGGHTPGSQVVLVETELGRVCLSGDLAYYYRNLELGWPGGVFFDLPAVVRAFGWMRRNADHHRSPARLEVPRTLP